ncbi:hypothetical protein [Flavobacterium sp. SM2513]|uniref:hypothetical protein n=1 Tax=Flavobacterium sp. SM2513 TaxID=3424766 RepID=UPI003D7F7CCF
MIKTTYLLFTLLCSISIFGQTTITTTITPQHQEIYGSKISIIAPKEFAIATSFLGFQQAETNSSVLIMDIPGPFAEVSKGLTKENLLKQGVQVETIESVILNGVPGVLITAEQTAYDVVFRKYSLAFGTDKESILINGIAPKGNLELEQAVKDALLSTVYHADKVLTPLDSVDFEISTEGTDFVFAKSMSNMLVYNRDGKIPSETDDKASLVVAKAFSKVEIADKKEFATNRIKMLPVQITKINAVVPIVVHGLSGYEITAEGVDRKTGKKEQAYQVMLFVDKSYYILFGSSEADFENNLRLFKKLIRTFKLK